MKKVIAIALVLMLCLSLMPMAFAADDLITVGVINNPPSESGYREANVNDFAAVFTKENGYDASFYYSIKNDEQLSAARQFITDGVDYLLISAAETTGWDEAEAKKIVESAINSGEAFNVIYAENDGMAKGAVAALDEAGITHGVDKDVVVMGFDCNKWALRELQKGNWNYDGQCSPFQAQVISDMIQVLEEGGEIEGLNDAKQIISVEKGFDAREITEEDILTYGLGEDVA